MKTRISVSANHIKSRALWDMCIVIPALGRQADPLSSLGSSRTKLQKDWKDPVTASGLYTSTHHTHAHTDTSQRQTRLKTWIKIKFAVLCTKSMHFSHKITVSLLRVARVILLLCLPRTLIKRTRCEAIIHGSLWLWPMRFPIRTLLTRQSSDTKLCLVHSVQGQRKIN